MWGSVWGAGHWAVEGCKVSFGLVECKYELYAVIYS
jgi:hypothetical protein